MTAFAAIDFETANHSPDSACAVGIVVASDGRIVHRASYLICPPSEEFVFTHIHGLTWGQVRDAPSFGELWPELRQQLEGVDYLAAHNAPFDRRVLAACCRTHRASHISVPFVCTVQVAREVWDIYPTKLPDVCRHLGVALQHHDAGSDAEACSRVVLAAEESGSQWR